MGLNETITLHGSLEEVAYFDWSDYTVFVIMLAISVLIGVYFGCFGSKQKSMGEYFQGGKTMNTLPVTMSLMASCVSGVTLVGVPTEVYTDTATYILIIPALILVVLYSSYFLLPVFYELDLFNAYEYLELRFSKKVRHMASAICCISYLLTMPSFIYVPSLCLKHVTGINLYVICVVITIVCIFYTVIGGLKAVVYTDFFQTIVTLGACLAIIIIGTVDVGGFTHVMKTAYDGGKLNIFNMDPNPFQRTTFWNITVGSFFSWVCFSSIIQGSVQRFMSLPSAKEGHRVMIYFGIGMTFMTLISVYSGLLIYTTYYGCDPIEHDAVTHADQIYPYFVLDKIGYVPALPGLFIAGIFSAGLSSLSTGYNTIAGIIYEDYLKDKIKNETRSQHIVKILIVIVGLVTAFLVFIVEKMGKILSVTYMISSMTCAPLLIMFILGTMFPTANTKGVLTGAISSILFLLWLTIGSSLRQVNSVVKKIYPVVDTCPSSHVEHLELLYSIQNSTKPIEAEEVFILYKLSYIMYVCFGTVIGVVVGVIISHLTDPTDPASLDPILISPPLRRFLPKRRDIKDHIQLESKLMLNMLD